MKSFIFAVSLAIAGLSVSALAVWHLVRAPEYEAITRISIEADEPDNCVSSIETQERALLQRQWKAIQSDSVLRGAIDNLDLDITPANDGRRDGKPSLALFRKRLRIFSNRETNLLEIRARSKNSIDAAAIANAIPEAYRNDRNEKLRQMRLHGLVSLKKQEDEKLKEIETTQQKLESLRSELKLSDPELEKSRSYYDAKRDLENLQVVRDAIHLRIQQDELEGELPIDFIKIVDVATPPLTPITPNRPLAASVFVSGLLMVVFGVRRAV